MCHAPYTQTLNPHTLVKPRGSALIPLVTPRPIPGPVVLTPGSSLVSYIVPTYQHESFMRTLSSLMRTRENLPVGHPSQIAPNQARLTWRFFRDRLPKKKMHLVDISTLLILLSLGPVYHHRRAQDITNPPSLSSPLDITTGTLNPSDTNCWNHSSLYEVFITNTYSTGGSNRN
jgi:hypothetical protein